VGEYVKDSGGEFTVRFDNGKVEITVGKSEVEDQEESTDDGLIIDLSDSGSTNQDVSPSPIVGN
jgi:hypothetical protein